MEPQTPIVYPDDVPKTSIVDRATWEKEKEKMPKLCHTSFPDNFIWGAAGSSYQYEGAHDKYGKGPNIWDIFTQTHPDRLHEGAHGNVANDFYHKYEGDVNRMKEMGLKAFRFSISWARILPKGSLSGGINQDGIDFYRNLIKKIKNHGMEPFVTLYHWDLAQGLEDEYGGFLRDKIVKDYVDYAELCFKEYGNDVKYWITFNECWTFSTSGYAIGTHAPGRASPDLNFDDVERYIPSSRAFYWTSDEIQQAPTKDPRTRFKKIKEILIASMRHRNTDGDSGTEPYIVAHNQILAHAQAVKRYREKYKSNQGGLIGMAMNCNWMIPMTDTQKDRDAAQRGLDWMFGWFMDPLTFGEYPKNMQRLVGCRLPKFSKEEEKLVKGSYDFLGLNYYTANYCIDAPDKARDKRPSYVTDDQVTQTPLKDGVLIGPVAGSPWLHVYPQGMKDLLLYIKNKYKSPLIYITENGVDELDTDDKKLAQRPPELLYVDKMRIRYHYTHLLKIKEAMEEGVNVIGYFAWSFLDNFEWAEGYGVRFGIHHVDYRFDCKRDPKLSSEWFKYLLHN